MSLVLTEDQLMFRDAAKRFAAERAPVAQLRKLRDDADTVGFSREVWKEMAEMGWAGVLVPEEHGGAGFGYVGAGLIAEEVGRNLSATPLLSTAVLAVTALLRGGSADAEGNVAAGDRQRRPGRRARFGRAHRVTRRTASRRAQPAAAASSSSTAARFTCSTATSPIG